MFNVFAQLGNSIGLAVKAAVAASVSAHHEGGRRVREGCCLRGIRRLFGSARRVWW